jgi:ABC-2 type transport system permease protein
MRPLALITWNDLRLAFSDSSLLLIMFAAPLAIATIISVTFGAVASESSPVEHLPVAVVNADRGSPIVDFGDRFLEALGAAEGIPPAEPQADAGGGGAAQQPDVPAAVFESAVAYSAPDEETALRWLREGRVSAVIVLPEDLSRRLTAAAGGDPVQTRVMTRPDREISGDIALTITRGILDSFAGGLSISQAAVAAVSQAEGVAPQRVLARESFSELRRGVQGPLARRVRIEQRALAGGGLGFNPLVVFGATQAIFFALFTANGNATSILDEERAGTLIRLLGAPTGRGTILAGKLVATAAMVLVQLVMLFAAFTLVGSLLEGELVFIWGRRLGLIALVLVATSAAAAGIGGVVASTARSAEQSGVIGTVINMFMAVTGGAFGFRFDSPIRYASAVFWGADAFEQLAAGGSDIWVNVTVLVLFAVVASVASFLLFQRRFTR